jgi:hypothetical protein
MARARIRGGCSDTGLGGFVELRRLDASEARAVVEAAAGAGLGALSTGDVHDRSRFPHRCGTDGMLNLVNSWLITTLHDRGLVENLTSQSPHTNFAKAIRTVYTMPRHTMDPANMRVIGIEKPTEAKNSG